MLAGALEAYFSLLAKWNAKINLTAFNLKSPTDEALDRLLIEPLVAAQHVLDANVRVMDVGSGSGSPALPFRLSLPASSLLMVEAKTRKAVFLLEAVRHLELPDVVVETARFEQLLTRPELHEAFDVLTIRAVRVEASTLVTLQAFLKPLGQLFWFQSAGKQVSPDLLSYPLTFAKSVPLIDTLGSRLVILTKQRNG
jgi:16S rRNA (guanine527-N7)-methyltransferase